jgi:3-hydroxybutyrate dehydrogenase
MRLGMGGLVLEGKVAVVTGGASGIGKAITQALAQAGTNFVIADLDAEAGERTVAELQKTGVKGVSVVTDVSKPEDVRRLMDCAVKTFGRLDILVNNAGLQHVAHITEFPEERWNTMIGVIMTGAFLCSKYALPQMMRQKWGRVINICSTQGKVGTPFKVGYVAAKHGLLGITKAAALDVAEHGITVNAICPAFARTPLVEKQIASNAREHGISENEVVQRLMVGPAAIKRLLEPSEIASLALYLCSDQAAGITGAALDIDLGWTAR